MDNNTIDKAIGSVEGKLLVHVWKGEFEFSIWEPLTKKAVRCYIPEEIQESAYDALCKHVSVFGMINYGEEGILQSIKVEEIKIFPDWDQLPSAFDVCGILR